MPLQEKRCRQFDFIGYWPELACCIRNLKREVVEHDGFEYVDAVRLSLNCTATRSFFDSMALAGTVTVASPFAAIVT